MINGEKVFKSRDSLESMIFPTAKVIGKISDTTTKFFVDESQFFDEEGDISSNKLSAIIVDNSITPVSASLTAIVSTAGTISSLNIVNGGIGYTVAPSIAIGIPTTGILDTNSEGEIISIFREKNAVKEVKNALECGISLKDFIDFKEKDIIESYQIQKIERTI